MLSSTKILVVGPLETYQRFQGGITIFLKRLKANYVDIEELIFLNSVFQRATPNSRGSLNVWNVIGSLSLFLKVLFHSRKVDIIYWHTSYGNAMLKDMFLAFLVKKISLNRVRIIFHWHFVPDQLTQGTSKFLIWLFNTLLGEFHFILLSKELGLKLNSINHNWRVIYNGSGLIELPSESKKSKNSLVFIGSIDKRKDFLSCIRLLNHMNNFTLDVYGEFISTSYKKNVYSMINELGLNKRIKFHGYVANERVIHEALCNSNFLLLPSKAEGLPLAVMEAAAFSCIPIISKVGSLVEIFSDKSVVWWDDDVQILAEKILRVDQNMMHRALRELSLGFLVDSQIADIKLTFDKLRESENN